MPINAIILFLLLVTVDDLWAKATTLRRQFIREIGMGRAANFLTLRGNTPFPNKFVADADYHQHGWLVQVELGVIMWSMSVYLRPNLQSAFDHQQRIPYPLNQGVYFINAQVAHVAEDWERLPKFMALLNHDETTIALYEGGEWHDGQLNNYQMDVNKWRFLTVDEFSNYLPNTTNLARFPITSSPATNSAGGLARYLVPSFALPKVVGINHAQALGDKKFRPIFNKSNDRLASGHRLLFNADNVEEIIKALQTQQRRGQQVTMNRYLNEAVADKLRKAFAEDKAFSVSLVDQQGELVAGVVGYVHGNRFTPDSVFGGVNEAKIADFALMRYLTAHQINFVDAGMVTNYTASLGGYRVSRAQFEELVAELPKQPVVLPESWQGEISIVVATKKTSQKHLQYLVDRGVVSGPLLLITTSNNAIPPHQQKADQRRDGLREVLANIERTVVIEANRQPRSFDGLPISLVPYLREILSIDVDVIGKVSIMKVTTMSGFPIPLLEKR